MLRPEELCWLAGHELGHSQCHHSTMKLELQKYSSDREYSADRAGLIAAASWIRKEHPDYDMKQVAKLAVLYGATVLHKLDLGYQKGPGNNNWNEYDYVPAEKIIDRIFEGASKLTVTEGSHPEDRRRIMAMSHFSKSQLFYRCLGIADLSPYHNLLDDETLQDVMGYHLKRQ